uniref:HTH La-type RNA-binding domain-containing protein n=1 Tax=Ananas comosus var. bracteatus TaxID=296719 RepID=A0A6V7Q768_ANACO|nr:unnamed protein product [Ananas comosus var. bracteatus]
MSTPTTPPPPPPPPPWLRRMRWPRRRRGARRSSCSPATRAAQGLTVALRRRRRRRRRCRHTGGFPAPAPSSTPTADSQAMATAAAAAAAAAATSPRSIGARCSPAAAAAAAAARVRPRAQVAPARAVRAPLQPPRASADVRSPPPDSSFRRQLCRALPAFGSLWCSLQSSNNFPINNLETPPTPVNSEPVQKYVIVIDGKVEIVDHPELLRKLRRQVEYYFSDENLVDDWYLKSIMDSEGWVTVREIAEFRKVKQLTKNLDVFQLLREALATSNHVEIQLQEDKMRKSVVVHDPPDQAIPAPGQ